MNKEDLVRQIHRHVNITRQFKDVLFRSIGRLNDITPQQMTSLVDLNYIGKSKLKDLSEMTGYSPQTLCMTYNHLEKCNLVIREVDIKDRRNTFYYVSENGKEFLQTYLEQVAKILLKIFEKLDEKDINELKNSMNKINNIMEKLF